MSNLIRNAIQTPDGTIIQSYHRHDYVTHVDQNGKTYMVDGGLAYLRRNLHHDQIELAMYDDEPHEVQREVLVWGTYGKEGNQPLKYKKISEMETDHIKAVLKECKPMTVIKNCMEKELEIRNG